MFIPHVNSYSPGALGLDFYFEPVGPVGLPDVVKLLRNLDGLAREVREVGVQLDQLLRAERLEVEDADRVEDAEALRVCDGLGLLALALEDAAGLAELAASGMVCSTKTPWTPRSPGARKARSSPK